MLCTVALTLMFLPAYLTSYAASDYVIYVNAVNGNDASSGSIDSPFKTILRAQSAVRAKTSSMNGDIVVYLREGTYTVENEIAFDERDSGKNGYEVKWCAYPGEKPIISGGKKIDGWRLYDAEKGIYTAPASGVKTRQLVINGVRAVRARSEGNILPADAVYDNGVTGYTSSHTDMVNWKNQKNIEFVYKNDWTNSRCPAESITETDGVVTIKMQQPGWRNVRVVKTGKNSVTLPWYVENAYELLDEPGEFYLDLSEDKFYYIPRSGENMETAHVTACTQETLLSVKGADLDNFVHDISFDGISFMHTTWLRPGYENGFADNQNATIRDTALGARDLFPPAMVEVQRAKNVNFTNCEFAYAGAVSLKMTEGIDSCSVVGNHIYDGSAHGIVMGEITCQDAENPRYNPKDTRLYMINDNVNNNYVHNVGLDYKSSAAISIGFLIDSYVCHNEISDVPYSGFHICYGFQTYSFEQGTVFRNVKICNNFVQNTMNDEIFDGGSIYIIGASGGDENHMIEVSGNYLKDQNDVYADLYLDNGSTYCNVHDNVVDQYSYPKGHSGDGKLYWAFANIDSHGHRVWRNYINVPDISRIHEKATDVEIEAANIYADNKWSKEALDIIDNAGLEEEYRQKIGGIDRKALDKIVAVDKLKLKSGESSFLNTGIFSVDGREIDGANISYSTADETVAVCSEGYVSALSSGRTTLTVTAEYGGIQKTADVEIFVDDAFSEVVLENVPKNLFEGNKFRLNAGFKTKFEDDAADNVTISYSTSNPEIMTVDSENYLVGISEGEAVLYVTASSASEKYTAEFPVKVYKSGSFTDFGYDVVSAEDMISSSDGWYFTGSNAESERMVLSDKSAKFKTPGSGYGIYTGKKYLNEVFDMNYRFNGKSGFCMFGVRIQGEKDGPLGKNDGDGCYLVVVKPDSIELQRVKKGKSYMLYGNLAANPSLAGNRENLLMPHMNTYNLKFGAVNYDGGVVLSLTCDGQTVFEYFDNSPDAITNEGHFGLAVWSGSMDISNPQEDAVRMETAKSRVSGKSYFSDTLTHWAINDIAYLAGKNILNGYGDGSFRPENNITRAEFLAALSDCMGFEPKKYSGRFTDISGGEWYADKVFSVLDACVIPSEMQSGGAIFPEKHITREEVAALVANSVTNVKKYVMSIGDIYAYNDVYDISDWAVCAVKAVTGENLMTGGDFNNFHPKEKITRAEAAVVLKRLYDFKK